MTGKWSVDGGWLPGSPTAAATMTGSGLRDVRWPGSPNRHIRTPQVRQRYGRKHTRAQRVRDQSRVWDRRMSVL
jgi:hypothetical protein